MKITIRRILASSALMLICGMLLMTGSVQADVPKSGEVKMTTGLHVDGHILQFSDSHLFWAGELKGAGHNPTSDFLRDHSWDCYGTNEIKNGMADANGFCTVTDSEGDKIFVKYHGKYDVSKPFTGEGVLFAGTGKYTGINGVNKFQCVTIGSDAACTSNLSYTIK